jgi:hypothetical protein
MIFQRDPNPRPSPDTLFQWTRSVLIQLLAGLEGSSRYRVQMLEAHAAQREHEQMLLKLKETPEPPESRARDREERLAGKDQNREGALSKEPEHA